MREKPIEIITRVLIVHRKKILVCVSNDQLPIYYLPGGHLEWGETLVDCLIREVKEETGFTIDHIRYLDFFENFFKHRGKNFHEINFLYKADLISDSPFKIKSSESHITYTWIDFLTLLQFKLMPLCIHQYLLGYLRVK